jgi:hypothetical protein
MKIPLTIDCLSSEGNKYLMIATAYDTAEKHAAHEY